MVIIWGGGDCQNAIFLRPSLQYQKSERNFHVGNGTGKNVSPRHPVQTGSGAHAVSYPMATGSSFPELSGQSVRPTTHLNLVPRLRMCGAVPPLS